MPDIGQTHLIRIERGEIERSGHRGRPIRGDQAGTILRHFRLRRRRLRRLGEGDRRERPARERCGDETRDAGKSAYARASQFTTPSVCAPAATIRGDKLAWNKAPDYRAVAISAYCISART